MYYERNFHIFRKSMPSKPMFINHVQDFFLHHTCIPTREYFHLINKFAQNAQTYLLLPLGKWSSRWSDFHWEMGCV